MLLLHCWLHYCPKPICALSVVHQLTKMICLASSRLQCCCISCMHTTYRLTSQCCRYKVAASCHMLAVCQPSPQKTQARLITLLQALQTQSDHCGSASQFCNNTSKKSAPQLSAPLCLFCRAFHSLASRPANQSHTRQGS